MSEGKGYEGHRNRLRTRFATAGADGLLDYELVELLLTYSIPRRDTKPIAKALLKRFKNLQGILDAETPELMEVNGIGKETALFIKILKGIITRYHREHLQQNPKYRSPADVVDYLKTEMGGLKDEQFRCLFLNNQNELISEDIIQTGTVDQAVVYPRKILEKALHYKATAVILVHNHPGGGLNPSKSDIDLTRKIKDAAAGIGLKVHDHILVTRNGYFSMHEAGLI